MREHRDVSRKGKATEPLKDLEEGAGRHCRAPHLHSLYGLSHQLLRTFSNYRAAAQREVRQLRGMSQHISVNVV